MPAGASWLQPTACSACCAFLLQGRFPHSWRRASTVDVLKVDGNTELSGCVPLSSKADVTFDGTQITGLCNKNASEVELQQRRALRLHMLPLLCPGNNSDNDDPGFFHRALCLAALGSLVGDSETSVTIGEEGYYGLYLEQYISLVVNVINGAEYVTEIDAMNVEANSTSKHKGLDLSRLVLLAQQLPHLYKFRLWVKEQLDHGNNGEYSHNQLPSSLPVAAPRLTYLSLGGGLVGRLPDAWCNWTSIENLELSWNYISGTLPDSWGQSAHMPRNLQTNVDGKLPLLTLNVNLSGTVPSSWSHFSSGTIIIEGTGIVGCMRVGLRQSYRSNREPLPLCTSLAPSVVTSALLDLKALLNRAGSGSSAWLSTWTNGEGKAVTAELITGSDAVTRRYD